MKTVSKIIGIAGISILASAGCHSRIRHTKEPEETLKNIFHNDFLIGTALSSDQIEGKDKVAAYIAARQFSAITAENSMKAEHIHPRWGEYKFELADRYVDFGQKHAMYIVGHTLIWHSQLPSFVSKIRSVDSLNKYMEQHIVSVAGHFVGKVKSWDVVNEALNEDGTYRNSIFYRTLGEDYIIRAFKLTEKAAPGTALYYNDYNIERPKKRTGVLKIIKKLKAAGARIDGIGIQGHWNIHDLPLEDIEQSIIAYANAGVKVAITELDISVLPNPWNLQGADVNQNFENSWVMNPYADGLPDSVSGKLTNCYVQLFRLLLKHKDKISRVTFWGVDDRQSWLNDWPIKGRTNYPLLFDRNGIPKDAFHKIIQLKKQQNF